MCMYTPKGSSFVPQAFSSAIQDIFPNFLVSPGVKLECKIKEG